MNKSCESCFARQIPENDRNKIFMLFIGKTFECPINDNKIICIYSKMSINWKFLFSNLRKKNERSGKRSD